MNTAQMKSLRLGMSRVPAPVQLAVCLSAALAGCSTSHPTVVRVEPLYRVEQADRARASAAVSKPSERAGPTAESASERSLDLLAEEIRRHQSAVAAAPTDAAAQHSLGVALAERGERSAALKALRQAKELAPGHARIRNNLGYVLAVSGRTAEARAEFEAAIRLEADYAAARDNLAWLARHRPEVSTQEEIQARKEFAVAAGAGGQRSGVVSTGSAARVVSVQSAPDLPALQQMSPGALELVAAGRPRAAVAEPLSPPQPTLAQVLGGEIARSVSRQARRSAAAVAPARSEAHTTAASTATAPHARRGLAHMPSQRGSQVAAAAPRKAKASAYVPTYLEREYWKLVDQAG